MQSMFMIPSELRIGALERGIPLCFWSFNSIRHGESVNPIEWGEDWFRVSLFPRSPIRLCSSYSLEEGGEREKERKSEKRRINSDDEIIYVGDW